MSQAPQDTGIAEQSLYEELQRSLTQIETLAKSGQTSRQSALKAIEGLKPLTEDINQGHHKALCITSLKWLKKEHQDLQWSWHPTNRGQRDEVDIEGRIGETPVVAAEVSASIKPKGARRKMNYTLDKLANLTACYKYYFVATESMSKAARNRVNNNDYKINIRHLDLVNLSRTMPS